MPRDESSLDHENLQKLLEENLALNKQILKLTKKNNQMLNWQKAWGFLKVFLIIVPLILGAIYLPPLLEKAVNFSQNFFGINKTIDNFNPAKIDFKKLTPEILEKLKK